MQISVTSLYRLAPCSLVFPFVTFPGLISLAPFRFVTRRAAVVISLLLCPLKVDSSVCLYTSFGMREGGWEQEGDKCYGVLCEVMIEALPIELVG